MKQKRALIIGINYAPEISGSAPYTSGLAEFLIDLGFKVEAYVGIPHYPEWKVPKAFKYRLRYLEKNNDVRVVHHRHYVPRRQTTVRRVFWEASYLFNVIIRIPRRPDIVFCSVPNLAAGILGVLYSKIFRIPLLVVVQDLVSQGFVGTGLSNREVVAKVVLKIERFILNNSDRVLIASRGFRNSLLRIGIEENKILDFPNWSRINKSSLSKSQARSLFNLSESKFIMLHTGNLGLKQDLLSLERIAKNLKDDVNFLLLVVGDGNQKQKILDASRKYVNLVYLTPVSDDQYPHLLAAADVLLVVEKSEVADMSLPSKLTSYLASERPILGICNRNSATAREIQRSKSGMTLDSINSDTITQVIKMLREQPWICKQFGSSALRFAQKELSSSSAKKRLSKYLATLQIDFR